MVKIKKMDSDGNENEQEIKQRQMGQKKIVESIWFLLHKADLLPRRQTCPRGDKEGTEGKNSHITQDEGYRGSHKKNHHHIILYHVKHLSRMFSRHRNTV